MKNSEFSRIFVFTTTSEHFVFRQGIRILISLLKLKLLQRSGKNRLFPQQMHIRMKLNEASRMKALIWMQYKHTHLTRWLVSRSAISDLAGAGDIKKSHAVPRLPIYTGAVRPWFAL